MAEHDLIAFEHLNLKFFQTLQIIPNSAEDKNKFFDCVLVGGLKDEALIVTVPESNIFPNIDEGEKLIVRTNASQGVALFSTTVLFIAEIPTFLVYLDFPKAISFKQIRIDRRVDVTFPVLVANHTRDTQGITGRIVNISLSGAQIELFKFVGEMGDDITVKSKFSVDSIQRTLSLKAKIMNRHTDGDHCLIGIRFQEKHEEDKLILLGVVSNAVLSGNEKTIF